MQSLESIQRQFTYSELLKITNNFERILGKGGFGTVYRGNIDGIQVAVKMISPSSTQGFQQFQSEARNCDS
jgi:predicted Ser/Thr protein kinase